MVSFDKPKFNDFRIVITEKDNHDFNAIQRAIDEVSNNGGGYVEVESGLYISKPISLKSNVCINVKSGALIKFLKKKEWYPLIITDYEGVKRIRTISPITADSLENIGIIGSGIFDGDGFSWRPLKKFKVTEKFFNKCLAMSNTVIPTKEGGIWYPTKSAYELANSGDEPEATEENIIKFKENYDYFRPVFVSLKNCKNILLSGVTFMNSPAWNIHPLFCENLIIENCFIKNESYAQNGDGLDVESCKNVIIRNNKLSVGDDGICLKSGKNREARKIQVPCENILIENNMVLDAHGGIVFGSEMSRGIKNVYANNNTFIGTDIGLRFKTQIGRGGVVSNIFIDNTRMIDMKEEAIIITCGYELYRMENESRDVVSNILEDDIPEFRDINISNLISIGSKKSIVINGLKEKPVSNVLFKNVTIEANEDIKLENTNNVVFNNCNIIVK